MLKILHSISWIMPGILGVICWKFFPTWTEGLKEEFGVPLILSIPLLVLPLCLLDVIIVILLTYLP